MTEQETANLMLKHLNDKMQKIVDVPKILFVEDGSVDIDELETYLEGTNIKVVPVRQGAQWPVLLNCYSKDILSLK